MRQLLPKGSKGEGAPPSPAKRPSTDSDFAEARGIPTSDQADETEELLDDEACFGAFSCFLPGYQARAAAETGWW